MPNLPVVNGSNNTWGTLLNAWLLNGHDANGLDLPTIGFTQYGPHPQINYQAASTTWTAMDTTNLTLSITVPASGKFYVDVTSDWSLQTSPGLAAASDMFMSLAVHNTTTLLCAGQSWFGANANYTVAGAHHTHRYYVTGQTPGATLQFDLVIAMNSTTDIAYAAWYAEDGTVAGGELVTADPAGPITIHAFAM